MKKILLSLIVLFSIVNSANAGEPKIKDLTIVVSSCDKYSVLWQPFFDLLFRSWPSLKTYNQDVPILLVSNGKDFDDPRVTVIKSANELGWAANVNEAVSQVKTKYVLYIQEDYFIKKAILEDKLVELVNVIEKDDLDYVEINRDFFDDHIDKPSGSILYENKNHDTIFVVALQIAIWKTEVFQDFLIQERKENTIWDFENRKILDDHKFAYYTASPKPIYYYNFISRSKINFGAYCWMVFQGYDMSFADKFELKSKRSEWLRREMPRVAEVVFYIVGFFRNLGIQFLTS